MVDVSLPGSFIQALQSLADWLKVERVPHVVIGGVAVSLLAQPRATQDIDIVIWLEESRWGEFLQSGAPYGFMPRIEDAVGFAVRSRVLLLRHETSGVSVDISCGALEFEHEMIKRAKRIEIGKLNLTVATPEDLIITKAVAQRAKDLIDIESLLQHYPNANSARIRNFIKQFADALDAPEMLDAIEALLKRYENADG